ncbi:MAG: sulfatase-like hydrolase/transferase [Nocardioidaceae bacterium]
MITADDAAPNDLPYMPHTRHLLAARGVTFSDAVAPTPICVPARASLLTGQYAHNHKALTISGVGGGAASFNSHRTLPTWLHAAGYDTLFVGKYLNGYGDRSASVLDPGWQQWLPGDAGSFRTRYLNGREDATHIEPGWTQWRPTSGGSTYDFMNPVLNINGRLHPYHRYNSGVILDNSQQMLTNGQRARKPWFMWVNYVAPHQGGPTEPDDPWRLYPHDPAAWVKTTHPAPRDKESFIGIRLPHTPNMFRTLRSEPSDGAPMPARKRQMVGVGYQQRIEALQSVDRAVARTVATLRCTHQLAHTVIVFASDNGFLTGQHDRYGKLVQFDDSERIPMVMAGPGIPHGTTVRTAVTNPDLATTIAAIAHARPTRPQDGVDILPWLRRGYRDRVIPVEAYPVHGGDRPIYTGIREGEWTYVHWTRGHSWEELYHRSTDPFEMHNLARDPRYRAQLLRFRRLDARYKDCAGDTCPKQFTRPSKLPLLYHRG